MEKVEKKEEKRVSACRMEIKAGLLVIGWRKSGKKKWRKVGEKKKKVRR